MVARHTEKRSIALVHYNPEGFHRSSVSKLPKSFEDEAEGPNIITPTFHDGTWPETQRPIARANKCTFARSKPSEAIIPRLSPVHHQRCCIVDRVPSCHSRVFMSSTQQALVPWRADPSRGGHLASPLAEQPRVFEECDLGLPPILPPPKQ